MKKLLVALALASSLFAAEAIKVGASPVPHAQILEVVAPELLKEGFTLEIVEFTDYVMPNKALDEGALDANFFQHVPYLEEFNKANGTKIVNAAGVHVEPMGIYSKKLKKPSEIKEGGLIYIPNDPTNESRALDLLAVSGLITLKDVKIKTINDIEKNDKKLDIKTIEAPQLPRVVDEADLAVINTNFAIDAGLSPKKDAIALEGGESVYVNIIAVKEGQEDSAKTKALIKAVKSEAVKKFIDSKYEGSVLSVF